jgi:hypothetical protein
MRASPLPLTGAERSSATVQDVVAITGQFSEVIRAIGDGTLLASDVRLSLQGLLVSTSLSAMPAAPERHRFALPEAQIANLRHWNLLLDAGWTDEEFDRLASEVPSFNEHEPLIPLTLCWTLSSLAASIDAKIDVMRHVYGADKVHVTSKFNPDSKHTRIVSGGPLFEPDRLWWQLIDLGANRFKAPNQVPAATAAGCEVFDVICQHPIYVSQQDGTETPYLDLPGLSVKVRGLNGPNTPDAAGGPEGGIAVHVNWEGSVYPDHAEPVREES